MARKRTIRAKHTHNLLTSPGTLKYLGREVSDEVTIQKVSYSATQCTIQSFTNILPPFTAPALPPASNTWLHINGVHSIDVISTLGEQFQLHPLLQERIMNTYHKPSLEIYNSDQLFLSMKALQIDVMSQEVYVEQVCFVLTPTMLLSFQESNKTSLFQPILDRLQLSTSRSRTLGPDYLFYTLMDLVIDRYFICVDLLEEKLIDLEESIIENNPKSNLTSIYHLKREIALARRTITPAREIINQMIRSESTLLAEKTAPYLRDLYDHTIQLTEMLDSARDMIASLVDIHLSTLSNRMNQVMKTLTIFSVIFLPITFIVGVYGMNFPNMPEFDLPYAYYGVWLVMILVTGGLITFFKWKKWM